MAIIKRGILGGFSGKVANLVGTSWKGRAVMKSLPLSVANPKTAGQVKQRTKFSVISKYASGINSFWIKPLWDRFAGDISGYNDFVSKNIAFVSDAGVIDYTSLEMSRGDLHNGGITAVVNVNPTQTSIQVQYSSQVGSNGLSTDTVYAICIDQVTGESLGSVNTEARADGETEITLSRALIAADNLGIYLSFIREDGTVVSDSDYSNEIVPGA